MTIICSILVIDFLRRAPGEKKPMKKRYKHAKNTKTIKISKVKVQSPVQSVQCLQYADLLVS